MKNTSPEARFGRFVGYTIIVVLAVGVVTVVTLGLIALAKAVLS